MEYKNTVYADLKAYIKEHHGFSMDELSQTDLYKRYLAEMDLIREFNGKRVKIDFTAEVDWLHIREIKRGKIVVNNTINFFEGKHTRHYKHLDAGLYEGNYATLIPLSISEV